MSDISIYIKKAGDYLDSGLKKEKIGDFEKARKYYLMAAEALLKAAKLSEGEIKRIRFNNANKLIERAKTLPKAIEEEQATQQAFQLSEKPEVTFKDVAGLEDVKEKISDLIIIPLLYPEKAKKWKIKAGGGVLLYGPPGTGKTLLAKAVAGELDASFFYAKASDIMSKWVGESEKKVAELFKNAREKARSGRSVIFIDEIDALLPKRIGQTSTVMQRVVPQFLAEMDGIDTKNDNILLMVATNMPWNLDPAALRPGRLDFKFYIPLPDSEARKKIFQLNLDVPHEELDFNLFTEMTEGYSGADIKHICDEVKREMFKREISGEEGLLTTDVVVEVINKVKPSVNKKLLKRYEEYSKSY